MMLVLTTPTLYSQPERISMNNILVEVKLRSKFAWLSQNSARCSKYYSQFPMFGRGVSQM